MNENDIKKIIIKAIEFHEYEIDKLVDSIDLFDGDLFITKDKESFMINIDKLRGD